MSRRQRSLLIRTLLFLFILNAIFFSIYLLSSPSPEVCMFTIQSVNLLMESICGEADAQDTATRTQPVIRYTEQHKICCSCTSNLNLKSSMSSSNPPSYFTKLSEYIAVIINHMHVLLFTSWAHQ
ncbi:uncharacterized protein LOC109838003 [Asparagus officinalis]|uniref:uncharacterized protein LOC109838003 n=1 Tax=Asparagus officinalis TaxID=4686 RepID=UPI00098E3F9E|nr:uncharacterized protein LOC109838003 [Asparagus officinalis]